MKIRMMAAFLTVAMLLSMVQTAVFAAPAQTAASTAAVNTNSVVASGACGAEGDNVTWTLDDSGLLEISGSGAMGDYDSYGEQAPWYDYRLQVYQIVIDEGITVVGRYAFYNCSATDVTIPDSVTTLNSGAFQGCNNLTSVDIPNSVTTIGSHAFNACVSLIMLAIPDGVTTISGYTFYNCPELNIVMIPDSVTTIGDAAFRSCSNLMDVYYGGTEEQWAQISIGSENEDLAEAAVHYGTTELGTIIQSGECGAEGSDATWTLHSSGLLEISGSGAMGDYSTLGPYAAPWYGRRGLVQQVAIAEGVTTIGASAFYSCARMTSVTIPASVTSIGASVFEGCTSVTEIIVDEANPNYSSDDRGVLFNKEKTQLLRAPGAISGAYTIPDGAATISVNAFDTCTGLTSVTIPDSVTSIGETAFYGCTSLAEVTLSDSITAIENGVFSSCTSLVSVSIPEGVTSIGEGAFSRCDSLTSADIPDSVTSIGRDAFASCDSLASVTIPEGMTTISSGTFYYCTSLTSATIPASVTTIRDLAFYRCDSLTDVYYGGTEEQWGQISIGSDNEDLTEATIHYGGIGTEPDGSVVAFGECGAEGGNVTWTLYEDGLLEISGSGAMADYDYSAASPWGDFRSQVEVIVIGNGVTTIGNVAFQDCSNLTSVTIPDSVSTIGYGAFAYCVSLPSVTIPDSVIDIGSEAFSGCDSLMEIIVDEANFSYSNDAYGVLFNKDQTLLLQAPGAISGSYSVPNSVISIVSNAFTWCGSLTSVTIPESVTAIGWYPFMACASLLEIIVDEANPNYSNDARGVLFNKDQTQLIQAPGAISGTYTIPDSVTSIETSAIMHCTSLTSVTIPDSVTTISDWAFGWCDSLTDVYYGGTEEQWAQISISYGNEDLTGATIHYGGIGTEPDGSVVAFGECGAEGGNVTWTLYEDGLLEISGSGVMSDFGEGNAPWYDYLEQVQQAAISEGITNIGNYAFYECSSLTSVTIPDSVASIGEEAFAHCWDLAGVTLPDSLTTIGSGAFRDCDSLTSLTIPASVTTIGRSALGSGLTEIIVDEANPNYSNDDHGVLFNKDQTHLVRAPGGMSGAYSIPDSVTTIEAAAFMDCDSLTDVTIPDSVTTIGDEAFGRCRSLTSVTIPDSVVAISDFTFNFCSGLTSVTIPASVTSIGDYAFNICGSLTDVYYGGTEAQWGQISIDSGNDSLTGATIHYGGTGTEPEEPSGDVDGSGTLDADDAIWLLYHTLFGDTYPVTGDCDFDGSGTVDADDAIYLLYHTLFGESMYPLN